MRTLACFALLALIAACDADPVVGPFDHPTYDVYHAMLITSDGVPEVSAKLGLAFYGNDAVVPGEDCRGDGGFYGVWAPDTLGVEVEGAAVGGVGCGGEAVLVDLLNSSSHEAPVRYRVEGSRADGRLVGTWTRGTEGVGGMVSGRLVRAATEPVVVP
ncbi:hypothetical protein [Rubrivirga sp. IMCC45206]|uniref:hypothetical protein n=1 Tax=Rubrivirga sp. IMCC45206 TaxID=3391614 RepID=UPI00398FE2C5